MAATYLTIGSKFRPFSYDELVRPLQEATVAHQALETEYADLDTKASVWENIADETTDPTAYRMYKTYADDLRKQADTLAAHGLTPGVRQNLLKMKGRYSQEITPIENAYNTRKALAEEQRKAQAADPTLRYQRNMATTSLDEFIANPSLDYGASYSGALLTKQVAEAAENLKGEMRDNPREWRSILGDQYYETLMTTGFSSEEVRQAIADPENANPILVNLVDKVMNSSGVSDWASEDVYEQLRDYANQGLYSAIGETKYDTLQNRNFISDYERWKMRQSRDQTSPIFYEYVGTELTPDENASARQLNKDLEYLRQYQRAVANGEEVSPTTTRMVYQNLQLRDMQETIAEHVENMQRQNPDYNPNGDPWIIQANKDLQNRIQSWRSANMGREPGMKEVQDINPVYEAYERLSQQFGSENIDDVIKEQEIAIKKALNVNKYVKFNLAQSGLMMESLRSQLLSGLDEKASKKDLKKRIHKLGSGEAPTEDELDKIFKDDKASLQYNPMTGSVIIESGLKKYEIDPTAAFHNISIYDPAYGIIPADEYLRILTQYTQNYHDSMDKESNEALDARFNNFFGTLYNTYNGKAPEAPRSSSESSTFDLGE